MSSSLSSLSLSRLRRRFVVVAVGAGFFAIFAGIPGVALRLRPFCWFGLVPFWLLRFCCGFFSVASVTVLPFVLSGDAVYCVSGGG